MNRPSSPISSRRIGPLAAVAVAVAVAVSCSAALAATPPGAPPTPSAPAARRPAASAPTTNPVKAVLAEERNALEREIAARMLRRADLPPARRARLELEIDLRILQRSVMTAAADARFDTDAQAAAWLRAKQFRDAVRSFEEARAQ